MAVTSEHNFSISTGRNILGSALEKISFFAHKAGMKLAAAKGKVAIEAQSDDLDVIADKVLKLISAKSQVHISAPEEILLTAGNSYIRISASGIEQGSAGKWQVFAAAHNMSGPKTMPFLVPGWKSGDFSLGPRARVWDELGRPLNIGRNDGELAESDLQLFHKPKSRDEGSHKVIFDDESEHIFAQHDKIKLTD
jgi:uncharacterized protein (DUF2345 family)